MKTKRVGPGGEPLPPAPLSGGLTTAAFTGGCCDSDSLTGANASPEEGLKRARGPCAGH